MEDRDFAYLKKKILQTLDIDLEAYKSQQMRRRLDTFVTRHAAGDVAAFCRAIDADADLRAALRNMLTINVTEFWRDPHQFERLNAGVLPELLKRPGRINIWSAGCSTGAEPYTVAIMLAEQSAALRSRILATDLDREVLQRARAGGPYPANEVRNVPKSLLRKYFNAGPGGYHVIDTIRGRVEFRELNLLSDRFEREFDLIICRNVMIYFSNDIKTRLYRQFHASLKPGGYLFVGGTEALIGADGDGFQRLGGNFYRKADEPATVPARRMVA